MQTPSSDKCGKYQNWKENPTILPRSEFEISHVYIPVVPRRISGRCYSCSRSRGWLLAKIVTMIANDCHALLFARLPHQINFPEKTELFFRVAATIASRSTLHGLASWHDLKVPMWLQRPGLKLCEKHGGHFGKMALQFVERTFSEWIPGDKKAISVLWPTSLYGAMATAPLEEVVDYYLYCGRWKDDMFSRFFEYSHRWKRGTSGQQSIPHRNTDMMVKVPQSHLDPTSHHITSHDTTVPAWWDQRITPFLAFAVRVQIWVPEVGTWMRTSLDVWLAQWRDFDTSWWDSLGGRMCCWLLLTWHRRACMMRSENHTVSRIRSWSPDMGPRSGYLNEDLLRCLTSTMKGLWHALMRQFGSKDVLLVVAHLTPPCLYDEIRESHRFSHSQLESRYGSQKWVPEWGPP